MPATTPDAILLLSSTCANCPKVLESLCQLVKRGVIGKLDVINLEQHPAAASQYGVRSVPWFRIGELDFQGLHSPQEIQDWANRALSDAGIAAYITQHLKDGQLPQIEAKLRAQPQWLRYVLELIPDMEAPMQARIGVGALFEALRGEALLQASIPTLITLSQHADHRVRGDACYYLGLTQTAAARAPLTACLADPNADVREIAQESLESLPIRH